MAINRMEPIYFAPHRKLGGGWICFKDTPEAPAAPDYMGAATATAKGDLEAARASAAANRVNHVTPYGNLTYTQTQDPNNPDGGWTATQTLSPDQQTMLDQQNKTSIDLGGLADQGLGYVKDALGNQISKDSLPADMVNAGQTGQDALMARFQPQIDESHKALDNKLANQGIQQGSEAYDNAMRTQNQSENDLRMQAALNGINVGENAQNQQLSLQTALQNQPLNMLNAVRTGSQVTNPTFTNNTAPQGQTKGADMMGALNGTNNYNMGLYNSEVATNNSNTGAAASAAGAAATAYAAYAGAAMF